MWAYLHTLHAHTHTHIDYGDVYRPEVELERSVQTLHRRDAGVTKDVREVGTCLVGWLYRNRGVCVCGGGVLKCTLFGQYANEKT